jgi:hypothetical protein
VEIALQFALGADRSPASRILADRSGSKNDFPWNAAIAHCGK